MMIPHSLVCRSCSWGGQTSHGNAALLKCGQFAVGPLKCSVFDSQGSAVPSSSQNSYSYKSQAKHGIQVRCSNQYCEKDLQRAAKRFYDSGKSVFFEIVRRWDTRSQTSVGGRGEMPGAGGTPNLQCIPSCAASRKKFTEHSRRPENYGNGTSAP